MLDNPQIVQTSVQPTALIHVIVRREEIQQVMGPGLQELMAAVAAQGIAIVGPWFTHHLRMDPREFDFEICVPVASPVSATGRIEPGEWPAMSVARTIYRGPYEGLGAAWGEFDAWIAEERHVPAEDLWERYLAGPETGPDSSQWQTELNRPLRREA